MTSTMQFFATKADLVDVFEAVESSTPLIYVETGRFDSPSRRAYYGIRELPSLGLASASASTTCRSYLIGDKGLDVVHRRVSSAPSYAFDQLNNHATIVFSPGGLWNDKILLRGNIGTAWKVAASLNLMRVFSAGLRKKFAKVQDNYLGPEAEALWSRGFRLTSAEQSPVEFDLAR